MALSFPVLMHWLGGGLLAAMATLALIEAKSSSLIPRSLFLWPLMGMVFGLLALASTMSRGSHDTNKIIFLVMGLAMLASSAQAFLVNIRKLTRWPSGAVWLSLVLLGLVYQTPYPGSAEPVFQTFFRSLSGFLWAAIGITKVAGERSISQEGQTPAWITLLYAQALLVASAPH